MSTHEIPEYDQPEQWDLFIEEKKAKIAELNEVINVAKKKKIQCRSRKMFADLKQKDEL